MEHLARNLWLAFLADRFGISLRQAEHRYTEQWEPNAPYWLALAQTVTDDMIGRIGETLIVSQL